MPPRRGRSAAAPEEGCGPAGTGAHDAAAGPSGSQAAAAPATVSEPEDLCCPITRCLMRDPVVNAAGHSYERASVVAAMQRNVGPPRDPVR